MVPYAGEGLEVGAFVFGCATRAEEGCGLAREGFYADEIARLAVQDGCTGRAVRMDGHS